MTEVNGVKTYKYLADGEWRSAGGDRLFDIIWINAHSGQRQYPFRQEAP